MANIINDYEIKVFAMQRSGHHAVIKWILGHFDGPVCFINDFSRLRSMEKQAVYRNISLIDAKGDIAGNLVKKDCLLINFEEEPLKVAKNKLIKHTHYPRGKSSKTLNLLILRDPYNLFASRLKMARNANANRERWVGDRAVSLWMQHAREFSGQSGILSDNTIMISYNDWFASKEYRMSLSGQLGLEFTDKNLLDVPKYGGGSSFDKLSKKGKAKDMKVLERWRAFEKNKRYQRIFKRHLEMTKLSDEIFGKIRG